MGVTTPDGLRYPEASNSPDIPRDFKNLADDTQARLLKGIPIFADAAARNAAIPVPVEGQTVWLSDLHQARTWVAGSVGYWVPTFGTMPHLTMAQTPISSLPGTGTTKLDSVVTSSLNRGSFFTINSTLGTVVNPAPCYVEVSARMVLSYGAAAMTWTPRFMYYNGTTWNDWLVGQSTVSSAGSFLVGIVSGQGFLSAKNMVLGVGVNHSVAGCNANQIEWNISMRGLY